MQNLQFDGIGNGPVFFQMINWLGNLIFDKLKDIPAIEIIIGTYAVVTFFAMLFFIKTFLDKSRGAADVLGKLLIIYIFLEEFSGPIIGELNNGSDVLKSRIFTAIFNTLYCVFFYLITSKEPAHFA